MGNSQSFERTANKGLKLFKILKKLQKEFDNNKNNNNNNDNYHHQQQNNYGGGNASSSHQYHPHEEDSVDYTRLRELAHQEAEKRNHCYQKSQEAYSNGDGAQAKQLSNQGHHHDDQMKKYNKQAADLIFQEKNAGRPADEIDLHGLFVKEATEKVDEALRRCQHSGQDHLTIIVGKGLHSPGQIAKLKPAIGEMIKKYNVKCTPDRPNPGCLYVEFGQGTGDLSWLDRITDRVDRGDCAIM